MSLPTIEEFPLEQVENFNESQLRDFIEMTYYGNDNRITTRFFPISTSIQKIDFKQQKNYGKLKGVYKFLFAFKDHEEQQVILSQPQLWQSHSFALCLCECGKWNVVDYQSLYRNASRSCGECKPLGYNIEDFKEKKVGKFDITDTRIEKIYNSIYDVFKEKNIEDHTEQRLLFDKIITRFTIDGVHFLFLDNDGNIDDKNIKRHRLLNLRKKELRLAKLNWKGKLIKIYNKYEEFTPRNECQVAKRCASYSPFFNYPSRPCEGQNFWRYVDKNDNILNYQDIFPFLKYDVTEDTPVVKQNLEGQIIEYYDNLEECSLKEPYSKNVISICCKAGNLFLNDITYSFYDKEKNFAIPYDHWVYKNKLIRWGYYEDALIIIKLDEYGLPYELCDSYIDCVGYSDKLKTYYRKFRANEKLQIFTTKDFKYNIDYAKYIPRTRGAAVGKRVARIDIDTGEVLKIYRSISEAAKENKCYVSYISLMCRGERLTPVAGFMWRYVDENDNIVDPASDHKILKTAKSRGRPVVKLSLDDEELERYPSIAEATRKNGYVKSVAASAISSVCSGRMNSYYGFKWKYAEEVDKKDE